eukprot:12355337-Alexandrium_andersonii.AAC.1
MSGGGRRGKVATGLLQEKKAAASGASIWLGLHGLLERGLGTPWQVEPPALAVGEACRRVGGGKEGT